MAGQETNLNSHPSQKIISKPLKGFTNLVYHPQDVGTSLWIHF